MPHPIADCSCWKDYVPLKTAQMVCEGSTLAYFVTMESERTPNLISSKNESQKKSKEYVGNKRGHWEIPDMI